MARKPRQQPADVEASREELVEVSKSQLKREALSKRVLAADLIKLGKRQYAEAPLDEELRSEIDRARKITSHVARKRQLMFVAKRLRNSDTTELEQYLENLNEDAFGVAQRHQRIEDWRDFLLAGGDSALAELLCLRPDVDRQAFRQTLRNAIRENSQGKPPSAARHLFRMLRELDAAEAIPPCNPS